MKVFSRFALILLLLLIGVLLGAWTYLSIRYGSVEDFLAGDDGPHYWQPASGPEFEEEPAASATDPSETPGQRAARDVERGAWQPVTTEPVKAKTDGPGAPRPDFVETKPASTDFDKPGIADEDGDLSTSTDNPRKPFVIRTRDYAGERAKHSDRGLIFKRQQLGQYKRIPPKQSSDVVGFFLRGTVCSHATGRPLDGVVVSIAGSGASSVLRRGVSDSRGDFDIEVTEAFHRKYVQKAADVEFQVQADGFVLARDPGRVRLDSENVYNLRLDRSAGVLVKLHVLNPPPRDCEFRVWVEWRNPAQGMLYDDQIFMSCLALDRGALVFRMPDLVGGSIRVGGSGRGWISSEVLECHEVVGTSVTLKMKARASNTHLSRGNACTLVAADSQPSGNVPAVRVESMFGSMVTYTDSQGRFEFYVPDGLIQGPQGLHLTHVLGREREFYTDTDKDSLRGIVILDAAGGVPGGPWTVMMPEKVDVGVVLPDGFLKSWNKSGMFLAIEGRPEKETDLAWILEHSSQGERDIDCLFNGITWGVSTLAMFDRQRTGKDRVPVSELNLSPSLWKTAPFQEIRDSAGAVRKHRLILSPRGE